MMISRGVRIEAKAVAMRLRRVQSGVSLRGLSNVNVNVNVGQSTVSLANSFADSLHQQLPAILDQKDLDEIKRQISELKKERIKDPLNEHAILEKEVCKFIANLNLSLENIRNDFKIIENFWFYKKSPKINELVEILELSKVNGYGIGLSSVTRKVVIVPFTFPGDKVLVELMRHYELYAEARIIKIIKEKTSRDELIKCKYFGKCSGCQLQHIDYENQLIYKQDIIKIAYELYFKKNHDFNITSTIGSPLQFYYRTKLTPHFAKPNYKKISSNKEIQIGFNEFNTNRIMDIDNCSIATEKVNEGLIIERERIKQQNSRYNNGKSLIIRETQNGEFKDFKTNSTDSVLEIVNNKKFKFHINSFFQNNNSSLSSILKFIDKNMFFKNQQGNLIKPKNLIDTYCGSGFFGISLSDNFAKIIGIEISREGYLSSIENARLNNLQNAKFVLGSAENIFKSHELNVNPAESVVIMDPSRKGSNLSFMKQLSNFKPSLIIYISCNVFTQARDLYSFFEKTENGHCYKIREIKGIDFFPQTRHVESVAILELKD